MLKKNKVIPIAKSSIGLKLPVFPSREESREILLKRGLSVEDLLQWRKKYERLRCNAPVRGAMCLLTFDQYIRLAVKAGISSPEEIGRDGNKFHMARKGDSGHYEWGNCRFLTRAENVLEKIENGGQERAMQKLRGRTKYSDRSTARRAKLMRGRSSETHDYIARTALKNSKGFRVVSPNGRVYTGRNLKAFCEKHGINQGNLAGVCSGRLTSTAGWTGEYLPSGDNRA